MGGKVQAMPGFADHVVFRDLQLCADCRDKTCIAMCSGQAITQVRLVVPGLRTREVRSLRRVPLELRSLARWSARQHRIPRRSRRPPLRGELDATTSKEAFYAKCISTSSSARASFPIRCRPSNQSPAPTARRLRTRWSLPAVLDPWAASALYEAANLADQDPRQQSLAGLSRPEGKAAAGDDDRRAESHALNSCRSTAPSAASATRTPPLPFSPKPSLPFRIWTASTCSSSADGNQPRAAQASRCNLSANVSALAISSKVSTRSTMRDDGSFEVLERVEGGSHQVSVCAGAPAVLGWATGNLPDPRNNPQIGMAQHARHHACAAESPTGQSTRK